MEAGEPGETGISETGAHRGSSFSAKAESHVHFAILGENLHEAAMPGVSDVRDRVACPAFWPPHRLRPQGERLFAHFCEIAQVAPNAACAD